ncbi:uncharacterized protein A1O9_08388 [Exophiala aquamarina CBS 119918]|uniref:Glycosyltransferase 2 n=1 Tax=Exophiala aquamarina CBS 119918 TaxID=1182545 RepID=A0A072P8N1_9EURO|nr:uncharacterized protein A1O9_08388 [Exophiala aquamarina CBS 119918]KEF55638.1 hypothetical protein A1O9_08388 [Exophiala aquamarina CBS 119918]
MAARSRSNPDSRLHGKKHDFVPEASTTSISLLRPLKSLRRRRVFLALLTLWLLYLFFKHMPTDVPSVGQRYDPRYGRLSPNLARPDQAHPEPPNPEALSNDEQGYEGPIKFLELARSLRHAIHNPTTQGNVLYAISRLDSVPRILPLACTMARNNRTRVHFAFMGRQSAKWDDIKALNGFADSDCALYLHDARPDHATQSSINRLDVSARASLGHIHSAIGLSAVFVGDASFEDEYLVDSLREKASSEGLSIIALPAGGLAGMSWISSLNARSMSYLNDISIEIIIHAHTEASANVMRLIRSIQEADYSGWSLPRVTIELPARTDPFLMHFLSKLQWPPSEYASESKLVLRHRIDARPISPVQASLRTIESYYPAQLSESHLLVVSPDVELSPGYFQYLMYTLLEYRYSRQPTGSLDDVMGISLELPGVAPDRKTKSPWTALKISDPLVLWQAPNSNACLYFGDKWVEMHTFLAQRLMSDPEMAKKSAASPVLSHDYPRWLPLVLEMMQARNYYMLYPTFAQQEHEAIATLHKELVQKPEEYMEAEHKRQHSAGEQAWGVVPEAEALTADDEIKQLLRQERRVFTDSLVATLLDQSDSRGPDHVVDPTSKIPLISFYGEQMAAAESVKDSWKFAAEFARDVGSCAGGSFEQKLDKVPSIESLFCLSSS